ncbi:RecQ family ATP-dependent DNA helicase, partial [Commensalibacter sp. Nvir]|uniref:RecQ family ATP-dependent DNA helicase n=1 Tax=Commensalibacter sp. Nvir TaxID=3069817 RepID=UPI0030C7D78A
MNSLEKSTDPLSALNTIFGFQAFRGLQEQAIRSIINGEDVLLLMPTGGGKSLCYQLPSLCRKGIGLVISPLIALMNDQVASLRQLGVNAGALHSEIGLEEISQIQHSIIHGDLKILYISPERLGTESMLATLKRSRLAVIAIDEAHCVSLWGHDFRPEYRLMNNLENLFPKVPRIALTATADPATQADILTALSMPKAKIYKKSFHRSNLFIRAVPKTSETKQLLEIISQFSNQTSIIYCGSRKKAERTALRLVNHGLNALAYHAGLSSLEKKTALLRFRSGEPLIVVATVAFGMGIDRPNVRLVVHLDMPKGPEHYYQQIGRAGRDGDRADAILLYSGEDFAKARYWIDHSELSDQQKKLSFNRLEMMINFVETTQCRHQVLLSCFGETMPNPCGHCDNCKHPPILLSGTVAAQKVLSAVYRTGQCFGALHIINVLRGLKNNYILNYRHDRLSLFGIGNENSVNFWKTIIRRLLADDVLRQGIERSNFFLNKEKALPLLKGEKELFIKNNLETYNFSKLSEAKQSSLSSEQQA